MAHSTELQASARLSDFASKPLDEQMWARWQVKNRARDARRAAAFVKAVNWICMTALVVTAALPLYIGPYQGAIRLVLTTGAVLVMLRAFRMRRYALGALFAAVGALYNPVVPTFRLAGENWQRFLILYSTLVLFAICLMLNTTDRQPAPLPPEHPDSLGTASEVPNSTGAC
jgi:hypothetical protein